MKQFTVNDESKMLNMNSIVTGHENLVLVCFCTMKFTLKGRTQTNRVQIYIITGTMTRVTLNVIRIDEANKIKNTTIERSLQYYTMYSTVVICW